MIVVNAWAQQDLETIEAHDLLGCWERIRNAMRAVCEELTFEGVANALDKIYSRIGHPVSPALLRAALSDGERNYVRMEWLPWFSRRSPTLRKLIDEMLSPSAHLEPDDLLEAVRDELEDSGRVGREVWKRAHERAREVARRRRRGSR